MIVAIIVWIVLGLIISLVVTRFVNVRNDDPRVGVVVGVAGAVICGGLYSVIRGAGGTAFDLWSLLFAGLGTFVGLAIWHVKRWRAAFRS